MKITSKLISQEAAAAKGSPISLNVPMKEITHLDLGYMGIAAFENLEPCINLRHLACGHNEINSLHGLERLSQLWRLDVNNNRVCLFC